jgi:uncharacterized protein
MLLDDMKKRVIDAMKGGRTTERDVLRVAIGEVQNAENRGTVINDEETHKIIRKLIKSNSETLAVVDKAEMKAKLEEENRVLDSLLPKQLGVDAIFAALAAVAEEIKAAKSDGQATGVAMKHLKTIGATVGGKDVQEAVKRVREASSSK